MDTVYQHWRSVTEDAKDKFKNFINVLLTLTWSTDEMNRIEMVVRKKKFRLGKMLRREEKYLLPTELERFIARVKDKSAATIRFGNFKDEKASDFCLVGGCYYKSWKTFYLYYRSVEFTLEFMFDMILLNQVFQAAEIDVRRLVIYCPRVFTSSREGRLKYYHKLYGMLKEEFDE